MPVEVRIIPEVKVLAYAERGQNRVTLLEQWTRDHSQPFYIVTLYVHDRADKPQTWARTDLAMDVARELYDCSCTEHISSEPV